MKRLFILLLLIPVFLFTAGFAVGAEPQKDFIRWIDFNVSKEVLTAAQKKHKEFIKQGITDIGTCEVLAYAALMNGNKFGGKDVSRVNKVTRDVINKYVDNKYYKYYTASYHAVLDGIIDRQSGETLGYFPIAKSYWYNHNSDYGNARGYGYKRVHLGNDLFGGTGAPIIAVERGIVTELGWNRFGGWRIGIRSGELNKDGDTDGYPARYYYYAHLRKGRPYAANLKKGDRVHAGDVIGYLGTTGYSTKEDTNMKTTRPHLHFGMQIIFDKSQEDGPTELWIDVYEINRFLSSNRARVVRNPVTKESTNVENGKHIFPKQAQNHLQFCGVSALL